MMRVEGLVYIIKVADRLYLLEKDSSLGIHFTYKEQKACIFFKSELELLLKISDHLMSFGMKVEIVEKVKHSTESSSTVELSKIKHWVFNGEDRFDGIPFSDYSEDKVEGNKMSKLEKLKARHWESVNETVIFTDVHGREKAEEFSGKDFNQFESNVELYVGDLERKWGNEVSWKLAD